MIRRIGLCGLIGLFCAATHSARGADLQPVTLLQVVDLSHLLVRAGPGAQVLQLDTLQADPDCAPQRHLDWVRAWLAPGTPLWFEPATARVPARVWLRWRNQRIDWSLLLLRLGHGLLPPALATSRRALQTYLWAVREARAEGRGIWGECGRRRSRFGKAAQASGIPEVLLLAIALCESGRGRQPWPWTLNVAGTPYFFLTRKAALQALQHLQSQHFDLVDVGLMQVNWHYLNNLQTIVY